MTESDPGRWSIGESGFTLLLAAALTAASYGVALLVDPVPVWVGLAEPAFVAPAWYLAGAGIPFGILLAEALLDFRRHRFTLDGLLPFFMLLLLAVLGSIWWVVPVPTSAHGLIVAYFLTHEMSDRRAGRNWKMVVGLLVLLQAVWFKLFLWNDPSSLLVGLGLGIFAWGVERTVLLVRLMRDEARRQ